MPKRDLPCKYATAPTKMWRGQSSETMVKVAEPPRFLCAWGTHHPESAEKLTGTPPWLQRNAESGHLMNPSDCETCPCYSPGYPVDGPGEQPIINPVSGAV